VQQPPAVLSSVPPPPPEWLARQAALQQQVADLLSALQLLEARAEAREMELARAEHTARVSADAAAGAMRAQYVAALRVKDDALEACRAELRTHMAVFMQLSAAGMLPADFAAGAVATGGGVENTAPTANLAAAFDAPEPPVHTSAQKQSSATLRAGTGAPPASSPGGLRQSGHHARATNAARTKW
jgi:hypothetical protein